MLLDKIIEVSRVLKPSDSTFNKIILPLKLAGMPVDIASFLTVWNLISSPYFKVILAFSSCIFELGYFSINETVKYKGCFHCDKNSIRRGIENNNNKNFPLIIIVFLSPI